MSPVDEQYPIDCPFCKIANAYPPEQDSAIPLSPDPSKVSPQCHLVLSTPHVLAFLDIMPISPGHVLLITREHHQTVASLYNPPKSSTWTSLRSAELALTTAQKLGEFIPLLSRALCAATGIEDWNIVQNNGARAAQVVPHVHFHFIPRYQEGRLEREGRAGKVDVGMLKSWKMFGRGSREDLDDEEGAEIARSLREELQKVLRELEGPDAKRRRNAKL